MTASTPNKDTSLKSLEAELDRSIEKLDEKKEAEELAKSLRQIPEITAVFILDSRENADRNLSLLSL